MGRSAVAATALLLVLGSALSGCARGGDAPSAVSSSGSVTATSPTVGASATAPPPTSPRPACRAADLDLRVARVGAAMSQPFADLAVANTSDRACVLDGYPRIRMWARPVAGRTGAGGTRMVLHVGHGLMERADDGPQPITIDPHRAAYFSVGTVTAYQGGLHMVTVTRLSVRLPDTRAWESLRGNLLPATRPAGRAYPVGMTALAAHPYHRGHAEPLPARP